MIVGGHIMLATALALSSCAIVGWVEDGATEIAGDGAELIVCPVDLVNCGHVFMCAQTADNALLHVEICVDDDTDIAEAEAVYGTCEPTPRHQGLCISTCDGPSPLPGGRGCNAFNGCFCESEP